MWEKGRRGSAKHGCTIDLLKFMINCRSPAICKNCLVLMRMGRRQRKKTIKYSYFESLHPAMSLALSSVSTISIIIAPAGQQPLSPGNGEAPGGSWRAAASGRPGSSKRAAKFLSAPPSPTPLSLLPAPACLQLEICIMHYSRSIKTRRAEQAWSDPLPGGGVGKKEQFAKENDDTSS